jgi:asparagine synthase (glutamine-hydrolysing)
MFAFAFWEESTETLYLARDRFGEKPLYFGYQNGYFLFASELKAIVAHPEFSGSVDYDVIASYLRFNYVPAPHSIYKNIFKLNPAHFIKVHAGNGTRIGEPQCYWSLRDNIETRESTVIPPDSIDFVDMLEASLKKAIGSRMVADVPLGAFLSGGVDSSVVVAMMQLRSRLPVKTFTIGSLETAYDESNDAARVAQHLGTEHHEIYLSSREAVDIIERLPGIYDEPFADSSQVPTVLVSEFTRRHVTVSLSGDGGDEVFGGYNRYFWSARVWPKLERFPAAIRRPVAEMMRQISPSGWDRVFGKINRIVPGRLRLRTGGENLHKIAGAVGSESPDELYRYLVSQWHAPQEVAMAGMEYPVLEGHLQSVPPNLNFVERMIYLDQMTYLPDDILCKVDRASMSASLEVRVPFLDNDLVRLAWGMPIHAKIHHGIGKWPLRQVLKRYVPEKLFERPKTGFGIPLGNWLRGPLRPWAEEALSESALKRGGYFNVRTVRRQWQDHLSGRRNMEHSLWSIIMFQAWLNTTRRL